MSITAWAYINSRLNALGINYAFMRWNDKPPDDYYFVGEYTELPSLTKDENGRQETTIILRGYTWNDWLLLEGAREKIENSLPITTVLENGNGLAVSYDTATPVPTSVANFKSIKINLTVQEWKV